MDPPSESRKEADNIKLLCVSDVLDLIEKRQMHRGIQVLQQVSKNLLSFFDIGGHGGGVDAAGVGSSLGTRRHECPTLAGQGLCQSQAGPRPSQEA